MRLRNLFLINVVLLPGVLISILFAVSSNSVGSQDKSKRRERVNETKKSIFAPRRPRSCNLITCSDYYIYINAHPTAHYILRVTLK